MGMSDVGGTSDFEEVVLNYVDAIGMLILMVEYNSLCLSRLICLTLLATGYGSLLVIDYRFPSIVSGFQFTSGLLVPTHPLPVPVHQYFGCFMYFCCF